PRHTRPPTSTLFPYTTLFRSAPGLFPQNSTCPQTPLSHNRLTIERTATQPKHSHVPASAHLPHCRFEKDSTQLRCGKLGSRPTRSEEHTSELQSPCNLVCRLL